MWRSECRSAHGALHYVGRRWIPRPRRRIARSVHQHRKVELTIAGQPALTVAPLGLVLKAGSWHVVVAVKAGIEVVCIDQLRATRLTNRRFAPPPDFDLAGFWKLYAADGSAPIS